MTSGGGGAGEGGGGEGRGGGEGGGGGGGVGGAGGHEATTFDLLAKRKLRPEFLEGPPTVNRAVKEAVFSKKKMTDRLRCSSLRSSGSSGLPFPPPTTVDEKMRE